MAPLDSSDDLDRSTPQVLGPEAIDELAAITPHLWTVYNSARSKSLVIPLVQAHVDVLTSVLHTPSPATINVRVRALLSDSLQLTGEILFDQNRYQEAATCYSVAAAAAKESDALDLWACAITRHAYIHLYDGRTTDALSMLDRAQRIADRGDPRLSTRHWISSVQAQAYARLGDLTSCERAMRRSDEVRDLDATVPGPAWLRFDGSRLAEDRGACYVLLGSARTR
jgi:hypothetical protein